MTAVLALRLLEGEKEVVDDEPSVLAAWLTLGVGFALDDRSDDLRARALLGVEI